MTAKKYCKYGVYGSFEFFLCFFLRVHVYVCELLLYECLTVLAIFFFFCSFFCSFSLSSWSSYSLTSYIFLLLLKADCANVYTYLCIPDDCEHKGMGIIQYFVDFPVFRQLSCCCCCCQNPISDPYELHMDLYLYYCKWRVQFFHTAWRQGCFSCFKSVSLPSHVTLHNIDFQTIFWGVPTL